MMYRLAVLLVVLWLLGCGRPPAETELRPSELRWVSVRDFAVPVLMYHRVCPLTEKEARNELTRDLTVLPHDFEEQMKHLADNGFAILSAYDVQRALLMGSGLPEKAVALTFDDGYRDNFEHAFPILKKYGASATIFLVKNTVNGPRHLSLSMLREMRPNKVDYGSHTVSHADLPSLNTELLDFELRESKRFLEDNLNEPITSLAYPAGRFDDRVVEHVQRAGYLTAWDKGGGAVRPGDDPFRLPRVRVHGNTSLKDFERKVWSGYWERKMERDS